jgi:hypothetical protein
MRALSPTRTGYNLWWVFDWSPMSSEPMPALICHLTFREAEAISEADLSRVGLLEPVRATMRDRDALVVLGDLLDGGDDPLVRVRPVVIPSTGGEAEFISILDGAVEAMQSEAPAPLSHFSLVAREVRVSATSVMRAQRSVALSFG